MGTGSARLSDVGLVMKERSALVDVSKELLALLDKSLSSPSRVKSSHDEIEIQRLYLKVSEHLANIGGFCDRGTRNAIFAVQELLAIATLEPLANLFVKGLLPVIVGIQVDFTKKPFKVVGINVKGLGAELKALVKK